MKNCLKARITPLFGIIVIGAVIVSVLILAGCATMVPIESVRPPTINTSGMQRLGVRDFEDKSFSGSNGAQIANYLTNQANSIIPATGKFTIVHKSDPNAEGVFTGEITGFVVEDKQEQKMETVRNQDGTTFQRPYTLYTRTVSVAFSYSVVSSRTNMPVGTVNKNGSNSSSSREGFGALAAPLDIARRIVDSQLITLQQDIVPTIVATNRPLMKETSKDKVVKQLMKTARALVKNNSYEEAIRQYDQIAGEYGSVAARENAAVLRESIASRAAARGELKALFDDKDGLAEKAAKGATNALNSKLPSGATITVVKQQDSTERSILDYVVDRMTNTVREKGIRVVERGANLASISAEQEHQLSGNVSDDSIVSIGKQLGAQYIVFCRISGEMSMRRLNLRVVNVETAEVFTEDFDI